jgi:hypothetical protein
MKWRVEERRELDSTKRHRTLAIWQHLYLAWILILGYHVPRRMADALIG